MNNRIFKKYKTNKQKQLNHKYNQSLSIEKNKFLKILKK